MDQLRLDQFSDAIGQAFEVPIGDQCFSLELKRAEASQVTSLREHGSFSLYWLGPFEPILPQATYEMRHGGQSYWIFIVPIGRDESGTTYEAVFN
jgi:hypothetical protein